MAFIADRTAIYPLCILKLAEHFSGSIFIHAVPDHVYKPKLHIVQDFLLKVGSLSLCKHYCILPVCVHKSYRIPVFRLCIRSKKIAEFLFQSFLFPCFKSQDPVILPQPPVVLRHHRIHRRICRHPQIQSGSRLSGRFHNYQKKRHDTDQDHREKDRHFPPVPHQ